MKKRSSALNRWWLLALLVLSLPTTANAHSTITGVGPFVGGMLHPLTTPTHLLILIALGLLIGQHKPLNLKTPLSVFIPISALALCLTTTGIVKTVCTPILISIALFASVLVSLQKSLPSWVIQAICVLAAIAIGLDSTVESGTPIIIVKTLLGTWTGLFLIIGYSGYYISMFSKQEWQKIGVRVASSWIIAASLMILAFALRR